MLLRGFKNLTKMGKTTHTLTNLYMTVSCKCNRGWLAVLATAAAGQAEVTAANVGGTGRNIAASVQAAVPRLRRVRWVKCLVHGLGGGGGGGGRGGGL